MNPLAVLGASLAAVLGLALIARLLGLGGGGIAGEDAAMTEAEAMLSGFDGVRAVVGSDGRAALVWGADGSVALLKLHGAQVAARRLPGDFAREVTPKGLVVDSGERGFGRVLLAGVAAL
ncbi:hypothetical protein [Sphingomonas hengshuiensis]|uniref:hypothetical protein n=1 Tax=Sphingomonas hengshuiensis TaxID=1609977 RepID=UPI0005C812B5|nr:hypothetical protein [Sphingomonas hengshuiensis]